jgi:hypothetical protein
MTPGSFVGQALAVPVMLTESQMEGSAGDTMGAIGCVAFLLTLAVSFVVAAVATVTCVLLKRAAPARLAPRFGLGLLGGVPVGALGISNKPAVQIAGGVLLLVLPALLAWSWSKGAPDAASVFE